MPAQIATQLLRPFVAWLTLALLLVASPVALAQDSSLDSEPDEFAEAPEPEEGGAAEEAEYADTDPSALTEFRPELDPYGYWVEDPKYGLVWVPHRRVVGADFAPYVTSGHWALTADGDWIWVSDYPFGWVVFHYGRWVWIPATGWAWIPGRRYAHAWVLWRVPTGSYAFVGWAPMPPGYVWVNGVAVSVWYTPPTPYVFCHGHFIFSYRVHRHIVVDRVHVRRIARHTRRYRPRGYVPRRGPSLARAGVPRNRVPALRTPANPRAIAASRPAGSRGTSSRASRRPAPVTGSASRATRSSPLRSARPSATGRRSAASPTRSGVRAAPRRSGRQVTTASRVPRRAASTSRSAVPRRLRRSSGATSGSTYRLRRSSSPSRLRTTRTTAPSYRIRSAPRLSPPGGRSVSRSLPRRHR